MAIQGATGVAATSGGEVAFNVVWNNSALAVTGDRMVVSHNAVFDAFTVGFSEAPASLPGYQDGISPLDNCQNSLEVGNPGTAATTPETANQNSTFAANLLDRVVHWKVGSCRCAVFEPADRMQSMHRSMIP